MPRTSNLSDFMQYLVSLPDGDETSGQLPSLQTMSQRLNISVARLREQLEVARVLGLVEVKPRTGIRRQDYTFLPAVMQSLDYALHIDRGYFDDFAELRNHLEAAYWHKAVRLLTADDHVRLRQLLADAWQKLRGSQIRIPHQEHRQLHMLIYSRLDNPFVLGILDAYWEAYEAVGLNLYAGIEYLEDVWRYHQRMVEAICAGDFDSGFQALVEHSDLLYHRPVTYSMHSLAGSK